MRSKIILAALLLLAFPASADTTTVPNSAARRFVKYAGPSDPATCGVADVGFNLASATAKICLTADNWTAFTTGGITQAAADARYLKLATDNGPLTARLGLATAGLSFPGSTSGSTTLVATAIAGATALILPAATDTLVGKATTDVLTNKSVSLTTNTVTGTSLELKTVISDESGSGALLFGTSPAITTPTGIVKGDVGLGNVDNTSDATKNAASVTLTNKTIAFGSNTVSGTIAQFNTAVTDADLATLAGTEVLTNKTISGASNTLSSIGNASLTNSSVTVGSTPVALGATAPTIAGLTLTQPTVADFTNATHAHTATASGGTLNASAIAAGTLATARGGTGIDTSASTGVPRISAGTWSANAGISHLASSTSADLSGVLSNETGSGVAMFGTSPDITSTFRLVGTSTYIFDSTVAAGTIELYNNTGASAAGLRLYHSRTDASNYDRAYFAWNGAGLQIGTSAAGTGTAGPLELAPNGTVGISISTAQIVTLPVQALTAGTMTGTYEAVMAGVTTCRSWTNAQVAALAGTAGDIAFGTLPAKTVVTNAYIVITGAAAGPTTVTVAFGRVSASYIDYIVASDAKAAANTVYGDSSAERGTNLTSYDLPSYTGTTVLNAHFISTVANLSTTTGSTGMVCVTTEKLP